MIITIPDFCMVVLVGSSGSGKSTFAARHFMATEVISSDVCRGLVDDDPNSLAATNDAFALVHFIAETRLKRRRVVVIDATNVRKEDRSRLVSLAKRYHALPVAIVLNPGEDVCHDRNRVRADRQFGPNVVRNQTANLRSGLSRLEREGFRGVHELNSVAEIDATEVRRTPLRTDKRAETGPFDIIGDIHGCADELEALLERLGYRLAWGDATGQRTVNVVPPVGRRVIFLGDLVDRGPRTPDVLRIVHAMVMGGSALAVLGNHDAKFLRWLNGRNVKPTHGLDRSIAQMAAEPASFREAMKTFVDGLVSHFWLDGGRLVVAHAGIRADMIGRSSGAVREFCLYGETTGETDEMGYPIRHNWAVDYVGETTVVYGHTPVMEPEWLNNTICMDTGCCFGGKLSALRWPEREVVSVRAAKVYAEAKRPPASTISALSLQQSHDDLLDLALVSGKRIITTQGGRSVTIDEAQAAAALEVMSRYCINPKWLVHLPPTMSPPATSARPGLLEHPDEAFAYYREQGVTEVIAQEKHMGSRALLVVCRDEETAVSRFGVATGETGAIYTRTGRAFFGDGVTTEAVLARVREAMKNCDLWARHGTSWALLDAEIMPWSAKAQGLIRDQYAAIGAAATAGLDATVTALEMAVGRDPSLGEVLAQANSRRVRVQAYVEAYRRYCWPVVTLDDYRIAPFHLLATEGRLHMDQDHTWHMAEMAGLAAGGDPMLMGTAHRLVDLGREQSVAEATDWWGALTAKGGEGMVVKPRPFVARGAKGLVQPAVKCRGLDYLRLIYGPEYDAPENLARLRSRGLGRKRSLAIREFLLGQEALVRFLAREPLRRVHEAVFGVLALETDPVDPRL